MEIINKNFLRIRIYNCFCDSYIITDFMNIRENDKFSVIDENNIDVYNKIFVALSNAFIGKNNIPYCLATSN